MTPDPLPSLPIVPSIPVVPTEPAPPAVVVPPPVVPTNPPSSTNLVALTSATSCGIPGFRESLLARINAARAAGRSCGSQAQPSAAALAWNDKLFSAAARHSVDMASRNYFSHASPEGVDAAGRTAAEGYGWSALGENIAAGDVSVDGVMATWMGSEAHCRNIVNPVFADVAVACVARGGTTWGTYWTMVLAR
ncbi:MAG: CAP domain-containing protein [Ramlibacter sp.]